MASFRSLVANTCLLSVDSIEREAKSKEEKKAEIKKLTAEIGAVTRLHSDDAVILTRMMSVHFAPMFLRK